MGTIQPRIHLRGKEVSGPIDQFLLEPAFQVARDLRPVWEEAVPLARQVVAAELQGGYWEGPDGVRRRHESRHPFGTWRPRRTLLGRDYMAAWLGGSGSILQTEPRRVVFGVSGSRFPHAVFHRGGTGRIEPSGVMGRGILVSSGAQLKPWKRTRGKRSWGEPQKWAIWWFLFFNRGVALSATKLRSGLFTPYRPHATASVPMANALSQVAKRQMIKALLG